MSLETLIKTTIEEQGPLAISHYMALSLMHPVYGYYQAAEPFGAEGDFITAPEISKLFGDCLGLWLGQTWADMGEPEIDLIELGPGRGTLMADLLRTAGYFEGFNSKTHVHMIEKSKRLRAIQKEAFEEFPFKPQWHDTLPSFSGRAPVVVANEFLDALPINQYVYANDGWHERMVGLKEGNLAFVAAPTPTDPKLIPAWVEEEEPEEGDILELSPAVDAAVDSLCSLLLKGKGLACLIDYGYGEHSLGDSFQAVKRHQYQDVLEEPGTADLTAHVNFARIVEQAEARGLMVYGAVTQRDFLVGLGIEALADLFILQAQENNVAASPIRWGLNRLISPEEMGTLFKVIILAHPDLPTIKPFVGPNDQG